MCDDDAVAWNFFELIGNWIAKKGSIDETIDFVLYCSDQLAFASFFAGTLTIRGPRGPSSQRLLG
jgi:hypothetical protein